MMRQVRQIVERFGLSVETMGRLDTVEAQDTIFVGTPDVMRFDAVRPLRRGIRLCRLFPHSVKPTTWAMQILGRQASRNVIEVNEEQARLLTNGGQLEVESPAENGFVILRWRGFVLGVGLYKRPLLKSQIPRFRPVE